MSTTREAILPATATRTAARVREAPRARAVTVPHVLNLCALCGRVDGRVLFRVDGSLIVRCEQCGLVRDATRPVAARAVYGADYYSTESAKGGYANYVLDAEVNRLTFTARLHAIEARLGRKGRLLDVGCALGDFLALARGEGWQVEGAEISMFAANEARKKGLRVFCGALEDLRAPSGRYDAITLYDVIEHLSDPIATLKEIRRLLVPGGVVHIVTPNVGGLQARLLGASWYHYKPGEHLFYFSPTTLRRATRDAGLAWDGWARSGSYVTATYVMSRLRYYAPRLFGALEAVGRTIAFGPVPFKLYVGEMEAWAIKTSPRPRIVL
ncbi:MAG: methyltransferase domain-containing protein [Chloroflexota bacterium]|nr:methyltransferase domain-containing protein [Chloroflexota bacterium]